MGGQLSRWKLFRRYCSEGPGGNRPGGISLGAIAQVVVVQGEFI